ncbi:MAG: TVP38/TMEM64 family protein [Lachnospiraceae bacterium]|nr:TVP38/TMEM64 family protein [Lachnospiraceae bacterium]
MIKDLLRSKKFWIASISLLIVVAVATALVLYLGEPIIDMMADRETFRSWIHSFGPAGWLIFIGLEVLQVVISVIPAGPVNIAAGYSYGIFWGTVLCLIGDTLGSMIVFLLVKRFGMKIIRIFFKNDEFKKYESVLNRPKLKLFMFISFMIPNTPKDQFCYIAGLSDISVAEWFVIVSIGRMPSILISTLMGNAAYRSDLRSFILIFAFSVAACILAYIFYRRWNLSQGGQGSSSEVKEPSEIEAPDIRP